MENRLEKERELTTKDSASAPFKPAWTGLSVAYNQTHPNLHTENLHDYISQSP